MKLKPKSYPHPVLGNKDDVSGYAFQADFNISTDRKFYYLNIGFMCSNPTLRRLVSTQQAAYVVHIECTNTLFRQGFTTSESRIEEKISADDLKGTVEVTFFICAQTDIDDYRIEGSHSDYSNAGFQANKGDVLAVYEQLIFQAEKDYDAVKNITSIMQLERAKDPLSKEMEVAFQPEKIRIFLPHSDFDLYNRLKSNPGLQDVLTCGIVLPVLVQAVGFLKTDKEADESLEDSPWLGVLKTRLSGETLNDENDFFRAAQKLLEYPLRRALESAAASYDTD